MVAPLIDTIGRTFDFKESILGAYWLPGGAHGAVAMFVSGAGVHGVSADGAVEFGPHLGDTAFDLLPRAACPGWAADLLIAAEDGTVYALDAEGGRSVVATFKGKWIEAIAAHPGAKLAAVAFGKEVAIVSPKGELHRFEHPATVQGLAFDPSGRRICAAHYGGVTISWAASPDSRRKSLNWKGSHLSAVWSRDGKFVVTTMQENALHGWRLQDGQHFRMAGYPAKIRAVSFSADGKWLASAGADEVVLWPFQGANGPMGQNAAVIGQLATPCTAIACHPQRIVLAAGGADGETSLMPIGTGAALLVEKAHGARTSALAWSADGGHLAIGYESGRAGVLDFREALA
jgi:WD40 repeat protein